MPLGPFDPIPPREKVRRSHINDLRTALTGIQDAYDVAVANGFTGTRGQWLDSLKGEKGDPGEDGTGTVEAENDADLTWGLAYSDGKLAFGGKADGSLSDYNIDALETQLIDRGNIGGGGAVDSVNGQTGAVVLDIPTAGAIPATLTDGIQEWWVYPLATYLATPYPRTVFGAIAADGSILACEIAHRTGAVRRYDVASAGVDDHNTPALWAMAGHRPLIAWTNHGADTLVRVKAGDPSGDLSSLVGASEASATVGGFASAYTQVFRIDHLSDATQDTFWVWSRRSNKIWGVLPVTVQQADGAITFGSYVQVVTSGLGAGGSDQQCYASVADAYDDGNQTLRVAVGYNPGASEHAVTVLEIDCVTGAITNPSDGTLTANMDGTNLPLVDTALVPWIANVASGDSRRLFYMRPGPDSIAVAYADWTVGDEDNAIYYVTEDIGGTPTTTALGTAGTRIGNVAASNYIAGLAFPDPSDGRIVYRAMTDGTTETLERVYLGDGAVAELLVEQATSAGRIARPAGIVGGGPLAALYSNVTSYGASGYTDWTADVEGI